MKRLAHAGLLGMTLLFSATVFSDGLPPPDATHTLPNSDRWHAIARGDSVEGFHQTRLREEDEKAAYPNRFEPVMDNGISVLPVPQTLPVRPRHLSLREAIAIALRNNPNVKIGELQRILDKFGLEISLQSYRVQWDPFTLTSTLQNKVHPQWNAGIGASVNAPSGTNVSVVHSNNLLGGLGNTQLNVTQHLMQGFGFAVNNVPYLDALDNERNAQLTFKNTVITSVVTVITSYRALVEAYNTLDADKASLESQEETVRQSQLQVKEGQMAPSDLLQQQANLESTRLTYVQEQDTVRDTYLAFLTSLGLVPSTSVLIDRDIKVDNIKIPSRKECIALALKNNIAYLQALLQLNITKRALILAEDARKWTLDLTSGVTLGSQRSAVGSPIESINTNPTLGLSLSVPIDNISNKENVVSSKIAIEDAKLNLEQQKETLVSQVMDQVEAIKNDEQQLKISILGVKLQQQTLENAKLKLKYGKSTVFEVNTLVTQLLQQQISLIATEIGYLNDVTTLYETLGLTLDRWNIKLRY